MIAAALAAPVPEDKVVLAHHGLPGYGLGYAGHLGYTGHVLTGFTGHGLGYAAHGLAAGYTGVQHVPVGVGAAVVPGPAVEHTAYSYTAPQRVELAPAEVKVPITRTHVEVPVHQKVHYGTQAYVAGATTSIHKPSLAAPAIAPPSTLLSKVAVNAPEVTVQTQEIPVDKHVPNFVDTPYHAGTIVKYTEPVVKEVKVPTPYAKPVPVPHAVPVPHPVAVPHPVEVPTPVHSVSVHHPVVHQAVQVKAGW